MPRHDGDACGSRHLYRLTERNLGQVYQLGKARRQAPPLALPKSLLAAAETFGFDLPNTFDHFILRRCKEGTTVFIKGGRLTLNLSHAFKVYPANFAAARKWITAIAERQRWQMSETKKF